jgi:transcriptional regulator
MYVPQHYVIAEHDVCHRTIAEHSFGELVTVDPDGLPFATRLPFLIDPARGPNGTLFAHMAHANPQWRHFAKGKPALTIFHGPHAYVSPEWYGIHPAVPTWNYIAVHAYGLPKIIKEPDAVKEILCRLVDTNEAANGTTWRMDTLTDEYLAGMMEAIVAFEIHIDRLEGTAKLSQNRSADDQGRVATALAYSKDPLVRALAKEMRRVMDNPASV